MNLKRGLVAMLGAFVVLTASDFVIHHVWLREVYRASAAWWRPAAEMKSLMNFMFASEAVLAVLLTVVYAKGYEAGKGTTGQGFRFGVLMGLLLMLPPTLMKHFVYPYPVSLLLNWFLGGVVQMVLAGLVIGVLYQPEK